MRTAAATPATAAPAIHIFKAGRHTTMAGEVIEFSQADLAAAAAAYDPTLARAPLVLGHPKTDDPAQGWVAGLTANERGLFAQADQVDPAFAEQVRAGRYGAVSAKFWRPTDPNNPKPGVWSLRHVGFLGAASPAVKGLEPVAFADATCDDADGVCFTEGVAFSGWDDRTVAGLFRNLREWLLGKFGADEADRVLPGYAVTELETDAQRELSAMQDAPAAFAAPEGAAADAAPPAPIKETDVTEQEAQALREQLATSQRELDTLRARDAERAQAAVQADNLAFAEGLARDARIPTGQVGLVAAIGTQLQAHADVEFGEGDAKQPLHAAFKTLMTALPPLAGTGEQATRERAADGGGRGGDDPEFAEADPERLALDRRIRAHAAEHKLGYAEAARALIGHGR